MKTRDEILAYVKEKGCAIPHHLSEYRMQGHPEEFADFIYALQEKEIFMNYLEIGVAAGGTTRMFNDLFNFYNIVLVDNNEQESEYPYRRANLKYKSHIEVIGDSKSYWVQDIVDSLGFRFDFIYIDGDHSYDGVKADFDNYYYRLTNDGFIGFHDTVIFPGVKRFMDELKQDSRLTLIGEWYHKMGMALFKKN